MKNKLLLGGLVLWALFVGALWWWRLPADAPAESTQAERKATPATPAPSASDPTRPTVAMGSAVRRPSRPVVSDPRLVALMGTPDDALIEYRSLPDGRVIQEIDQDPNSQGYLKPAREYSYAGDRLAMVTVYKYLGTQLQVTRATASYNADGSVDEYNEITDYRKL
jgi:hypothetical protein